MANLLKERPLPEQEPSIASAAVIDSDRIIVECNSAAEASLLGEGARGRKFDAKLSEAVKFGRISAAAVSQIRSAVEKGSGAFHMEDGKVFVLHSRRVGEATRIEWTDISSAVGAASDREPISGLLTRHGFLSALEEIRSRALTGVVVHLDLDDFKGVNDLFGHEIGDRLIRRVTERISGQLDGAKAGLAHGTGGEFYFVIENDHAETLIAGLLDILGRPYLIDGNMIYSTASMGSTPYAEGDGNETIVRSASLALRNAKADGGNQHVTFTADMQRALQRRHALEIELRKALTLREFSLAYQPQFRIEGRRLVGFEALLRWNHPTNGAVSPGEFIPLAEELGLIVPIGEWVLRTACQQAASWPADILDLGQRLAAAIPQPRDRRHGALSTGGVWTEPSTPRSRGDGRRDPYEQRSGHGHVQPVEGARRAVFHGRFRHGLLVAELPAEVSVRQDRPVVRQNAFGKRRQPRHHQSHLRTRQSARHDHHCRRS